MKANRFVSIAALLIVFAVPALAQKGGKDIVGQFLRQRPQLRMKSATRVHPIRVAGTWQGKVVTPYYPVSMVDNDWPNGPWSTIYDCIEVSPVIPGPEPIETGEPYENPAYGPAYMVPPNYGLETPSPGSRWYFGDAYENTFITNDMEINPLYAGFEADRVAHMWEWNPVNPTERMIVNIALTETFAATEAGLAPPPMGGPNNVSWSGFIDGVALDYGDQMGAGYAEGAYFDNFDMSSVPTPIQISLPVDGKGAYIMQLLSSTEPPTLASRGQFFLWMCKQTNAALPGGNHSKQGINQWDDDVDVTSPAPPGDPINNSDGRHMTNPPGPDHLVEFYEYPHSILEGLGPLPPGNPEPLGATMGLYSQFGAFAADQDSDMLVLAGELLTPDVAARLRAVDNNAVIFGNESLSPATRFEVTISTPATTTDAISVMARTRSSRSDVSEFLEIRNVAGNAWQTLNFRVTTLAYFDIRANVTANASNFLAPNGDVRLRMRYVPNADMVAADGWNESIDRLTVFVKGVQSN